METQGVVMDTPDKATAPKKDTAQVTLQPGYVAYSTPPRLPSAVNQV